jgi:hypothetical protein
MFLWWVITILLASSSYGSYVESRRNWSFVALIAWLIFSFLMNAIGIIPGLPD